MHSKYFTPDGSDSGRVCRTVLRTNRHCLGVGPSDIYLGLLSGRPGDSTTMHDAAPLQALGLQLKLSKQRLKLQYYENYASGMIFCVAGMVCGGIFQIRAQNVILD